MTRKNRGTHTTNANTQTQEDETKKVQSQKINKHIYMTKIDMYVGWEMGEGGYIYIYVYIYVGLTHICIYIYIYIGIDI